MESVTWFYNTYFIMHSYHCLGCAKHSADARCRAGEIIANDDRNMIAKQNEWLRKRLLYFR